MNSRNRQYRNHLHQIFKAIYPIREEISSHNHCTFCDQKLPAGNHQSSALVCTECLQTLPYIPMHEQQEHVLSAFYYESPISDLILAAKSGKQLHYLQLLADLTDEYFTQYLHQNPTRKPQAIIPVPLHHKKLRQRGFNQSLELIRPFSRQQHIPLLSNVVKRQRDTLSQKSLNATQRQENVDNAFSLTQTIKQQNLVIFDDVSTTGATCQALQKTLHKQYFTQIKIWTCASTKEL